MCIMRYAYPHMYGMHSLLTRYYSVMLLLLADMLHYLPLGYILGVYLGPKSGSK